MKLTCITATFNCIQRGNRDRLIRCIESIEKLKTEHEHLIYDGESTDGTAELLFELEKNNKSLKVISEPDTGIYNALNKGVRDAKGEWFYVLGADDFIEYPDIMDKIVRDVDCDEIVTPVMMDNHTIRKVGEAQIFHCTPYCHQGVLQKIHLVREFGGFEENYRIAADYDLILKFHETSKKIVYLSSIFAHFGSGGVSNSCLNALDAEFNEIISCHFKIPVQNAAAYRESGIVPAKIIFKYLNSEDYLLRKSARIELKINIKNHFRNVLGPFCFSHRTKK